jgi:hypothetical protein
MMDHFAKVLYTEETYHDAGKHIGLFLQRLYVGRKDIVNSSACLITPPQVK